MIFYVIVATNTAVLTDKLQLKIVKLGSTIFKTRNRRNKFLFFQQEQVV